MLADHTAGGLKKLGMVIIQHDCNKLIPKGTTMVTIHTYDTTCGKHKKETLAKQVENGAHRPT